MPEYPITDWSGAVAGDYGRGGTGLGPAMLRHSRQRWRLWIMAAAERVWGRERRWFV